MVKRTASRPSWTKPIRPCHWRGPDDWIYVATRREVLRVADRDGDGRAEQRQTLARLETAGDYPHNGLAGLTFAEDGRLYFGLGENLGAAYRLVGSDGVALRGEGEGGNVFACQPDGGQLKRIATGFWNPFGSCFDPHKRLFTIDNDPDASPPCRLLNIVAAGDYGYQFRYGRSGRHPLQAWDAELPGTLPMAGGTGEAPCQIVPYRGRLWISSWGDFRIEAHSVHTVGASVQTQSEVIVQGDARFRPVGLAAATDGSLYFSDWVERSYPVHTQGRIWRLIPDGPPTGTHAFPPLSDDERRAKTLRTANNSETLIEAMLDDDVFIRQAASAGLAASGQAAAVEWQLLEHPWQRLGVLEASRWQNPEAAERSIPRALQDPSDAVAIYALRMIAERRAEVYRQDVLDLLSARQPLGAQLGAVALATLAWLDEGQESKDLTTLHARLAEYLDDSESNLSLRRLALRSLPSDHPTLSVTQLRRLLEQDDQLQSDVVAILADKTTADADLLLIEIAKSTAYPSPIRADACAALSTAVPMQRQALEELREDGDQAVRREAVRSLRERPTTGFGPTTATQVERWLQQLEPGDAEAGRRVFFRAGGARCSSCHRHGGRGGDVGPELTTIHRRADRRWLLETILDPNRDVAPRFATTTVITTDGRSITGQTLPGPGDDAAETFVQADGTTVTLPFSDIEQRHYHTRSIMPEGLGEVLEADELADLIAFLLTKPAADD